MSYRDPYYNYRVPYDDDEYYYQTFPSRHLSAQYQSTRPKMRRSLSASNLSNDYHGRFHNEDPYHHYHYKQEMYDKNQYYEHVPDDDYEELDGEPMTELEKLAAKNALYNQACSRLIYHDNHLSPSSSPPQAPHPSPSSLQDNITAENEYIPSEPSLTPTSSSITLVDYNNNNNNNHTSNNSSTATNKESEQSSDPSAPFQKKKLWPFSSLFKKAQAVYSSPINSPRLLKAPTHSTSTPYKNTHYVSPPSTASNSPVIANNSTDNSTIWAFRVPIPHAHSTIWRRFDDINQQKLNYHVQSSNFNELDIFDSHIGSGKIPIVAIPSQGCCYYPADLSMQKLDCLEIKPLPSNVFDS